MSKILIYEFWYDYLKHKYNEKLKLCYMDIDSFVFCVNKDDIYKYIEHDWTLQNYEAHGQFHLEKNKKIIGVMKDELEGQNLKEFVGLRAKTYSYLKDSNNECKK